VRFTPCPIGVSIYWGKGVNHIQDGTAATLKEGQQALFFMASGPLLCQWQFSSAITPLFHNDNPL
ncbi:hypothetical protein, partial [Aeromonas rivipollensis]|uniref:hypothetical protein n=1 Tax=Aeromonas rivipollensis TaxID=948519 RepID=UPI003CFE5582